MNLLFPSQPLSRKRVISALAVAMAADGLQLLSGPFGWVFLDQAIDVAAMVVVCALLGFHVLFLPTFMVEFIPAVGTLPTWTACVLLVVAQRARGEKQPVEGPPPQQAPPKVRSDVIDV